MISNRSVPTNTLLPHLVYPDVAEAAAWLSKVFGFREYYRYGEPVTPKARSGQTSRRIANPRGFQSAPQLGKATTET